MNYKLNYNKRVIAFSDLGNNLIDRGLIPSSVDSESLFDGIYSLRVRIFTEVIQDWLINTDFVDKVIISYGEGIKSDVLEKIWDNQTEKSNDEVEKFGEAIELRKKNVQLIDKLILSAINADLKNLLEMSRSSFNSSLPSLSIDLLQSRTLVEGLSLELCRQFGLKSTDANLSGYIKRLEESSKISSWVTSYFHIIRLLGNEAAHYKSAHARRPERPVGKDLIVIHAALNRILTFFLEEN